MRLGPFALYFLSSIIHAGSLESGLSYIENSSPLDPAKCEQVSSRTYQKCARNLCGWARNHVSLDNSKAFNEALPEDTYSKKRIDEVQKMVEAHINQIKARMEKYRKNLKEQNKSDFNSWTAEDWKKNAFKAFSKYVHPDLDNTKPLNEALNYRFSYPENASPSIKAAIVSYGNGLKNEFMSDFFRLYDFKLITKEQMTKKMYSELPGIITRMADNDKTSDNAKFRMGLIKEILKSKKLADVDVAEILTNMQAINLELKGIDSENLICADRICRQGLQEIIAAKEKIDPFEKVKNLLDDKEEIKKLTYKCLAQQTVTDEYKKSTQVYNDSFPKVRDEFLSKALKGFSEHSKGLIKEYILKVKLDFNLGDGLTLTERFEELNTKLDKIDLAKDPLKMINETCSIQTQFDDHTDAFVPNEDKINVSVFSCNHSRASKLTPYHELAHALSWVFANMKDMSKESREEYFKMRECTNQRYIPGAWPADTLKASFEFMEGDKRFSEEDTADLIAAKVLEKSGENEACLFLDTEKRLLWGRKYSRLSLIPQSKTDGHSSALMRAIRFNIDTHQHIPESCKDVMEENKHLFNWNRCQ